MNDIDFDRERAIAALKMEEAQRAHDRNAELHRTYFEAASKSAEVAVKTSVVVNGGAAVAVLGFLGAMLQRQIVSIQKIADVSASLIWFASGVAAGIVALAFIYLMNYSDAASVGWRKLVFEHPYVRESSRAHFMRGVYTIAHVIAVLVALLSVSLFIGGVINVRHAITELSKAM